MTAFLHKDGTSETDQTFVSSIETVMITKSPSNLSFAHLRHCRSCAQSTNSTEDINISPTKKLIQLTVTICMELCAELLSSEKHPT